MGNEFENNKILSAEEVLALAKADNEEWVKAQIWTLEDYLIRIARDKLQPGAWEIFDKQLTDMGEYTVDKLTALGEEYNLLADYDLQTESLRVYCRRKGINAAI